MTKKRTPPNRQRPIQVKFFVNEQELEQIKERMAMFSTDNLSAHLRKLALEGVYENKQDECADNK